MWRASDHKDHVQLSWATASELNSSHFEIERSQDGIHFHKIGQIESIGTTDDMSIYEYIDDQPFGGISYYRLKQVDLNGAFEYTEIIAVHNVALQELIVQVYPYHMSDRFTLSTQLPNASKVEVQLLSLSGIILLQQELVATQGYNQWEVDVANLPGGMYYYVLQQDHARAVGKIVKQ